MKKNILCFLTVLLCTQTFIKAIDQAIRYPDTDPHADNLADKQEAERQEAARAEEAERQEEARAEAAERKRQALLNQNEQPTTAKNPSGGPENQSGGTATPVGIDATNREPKALGDGRRNFDDLGNKKNPESPAEKEAEAKRVTAERVERAKAENEKITSLYSKAKAEIAEMEVQINDALNNAKIATFDDTNEKIKKPYAAFETAKKALQKKLAEGFRTDIKKIKDFRTDKEEFQDFRTDKEEFQEFKKLKNFKELEKLKNALIESIKVNKLSKTAKSNWKKLQTFDVKLKKAQAKAEKIKTKNKKLLTTELTDPVSNDRTNINTELEKIITMDSKKLSNTEKLILLKTTGFFSSDLPQKRSFERIFDEINTKLDDLKDRETPKAIKAREAKAEKAKAAEKAEKAEKAKAAAEAEKALITDTKLLTPDQITEISNLIKSNKAVNYYIRNYLNKNYNEVILKALSEKTPSETLNLKNLINVINPPRDQANKDLSVETLFKAQGLIFKQAESLGIKIPSI